MNHILCGLTAAAERRAGKPHLQSAREPVWGTVCFASSAGIGIILIARRPVPGAGRTPGLDETAIVGEGSAAASLLWEQVKLLGYFPDRMEPPKR